MAQEKVIQDCKGHPNLLLKVANFLNLGHKLHRVVVEHKSDQLKGTHAHSRAKRKETLVYVRKAEKEHVSSCVQDSSHLTNEDESFSGSKKEKNRSKEKSKKLSKNQKRKLNPKLMKNSMTLEIDQQYSNESLASELKE